MNERIKELAIKAKLEHCVSHVRLQEFAELIINECCEIVDTLDEAYDSPKTHGTIIRNHFIK